MPRENMNQHLPRLTRLKRNKEIISTIATKYGWQETNDTNNGVMMTFIRDDKKIEVWPSKMTVATMLNHPKQGKTKLYRRNVWDVKVLEAIFNNPRVHTTGGYQKNRKPGRGLDTELQKSS